MTPYLSLSRERRDSSSQYTHHFQLGRGHLLLLLGHACETTESQISLGQKSPPKPTCSLPVSAWTGSGRERHQAETPSYAQGGFPDHGRIGNGPGHSNNGSENSESMVRHTGHSAQRSLPEILVKIPDSREQHILSSEPILMGKQSH